MRNFSSAKTYKDSYLNTRRCRNPRLPKPYPGCWKDKEFRRRYSMIYMRLIRLTRYRETESMKEWYSTKWRNDEQAA